MAKALALAVALLCLAGCVAIAAPTGDNIIRALTIEEFLQISSTRRLPGASDTDAPTSPLWIVRFHLPWESEDDSDGAAAAFRAAAARVAPTAAAHFAELAVDTPDAFALVDALQIGELPTIRAIGGAITRAAMPKGNAVTARVLTIEAAHGEFSEGSMASASDIERWVWKQVPSSFADPVTNFVQPTVHTAASADDIPRIRAEAARMPTPAAEAGAPRPAVLIVVRDLAAKAALPLAAAASAIGAAHGSRLLVFVTSVEAVAAKYASGLTPSSLGAGEAAVVSLPDGDGGDGAAAAVVARVTSGAALADAVAASAAGVAAAATAGPAVAGAVRAARDAWRGDVAAFFGDSPLRRIGSEAEFAREVRGAAGGVVVLFLLRETDPFFAKHAKIAAETAAFVQTLRHVGHTGETLQAQFRSDVFWIDAEVHPGVPKATQAKAVPSVMLLYHLKGGRLGMRIIGDGKTFPDSRDVARELLSAKLFEAANIVLVDEKLLVFADAAKVAKANERTAKASGISAAVAAALPNRRYLNVDRAAYGDDGGDFAALRRLSGAQRFDGKGDSKAGSGTSDSGASSGDGGASVPGKKKLSPEKEAAKAAVEEAKVAALREEVERKKREKEARIKEKAEQQAKAAEDRKAKQAEARAAKPKETAEEKAKARKAAAEAEAKAKAKAKPKEPKPPKDRAAIRKQWEAEGRRVADKYVTTGADGKVQVIERLDLGSA